MCEWGGGGGGKGGRMYGSGVDGTVCGGVCTGRRGCEPRVNKVSSFRPPALGREPASESRVSNTQYLQERGSPCFFFSGSTSRSLVCMGRAPRRLFHAYPNFQSTPDPAAKPNRSNSMEKPFKYISIPKTSILAPRAPLFPPFKLGASTPNSFRSKLLQEHRRF